MRKADRGKRTTRRGFDWHIPVIGALGFLLWTTNRRRTKTKFGLSGDGDLQSMIPTLVGLSEGAIDAGNRTEIIHNGAFFDRLIEDMGRAAHSIHIESHI